MLWSIEDMKADAAACNKRLRDATSTGQKPNYGVNQGKSSAVSKRHVAVRALMGRGLSHEEMARRLNVKVSTIKSDIATIKAEDAHGQS